MGAQLQEKTEADVLVLDPRRLNPRRRWLLGAAGVVVVIAVGAALWMERASSSKALVPLADRTSVPLVSVVVPGVQPVSTQVLVTGTIEARHDLPIGDAGAAGRIDDV